MNDQEGDSDAMMVRLPNRRRSRPASPAADRKDVIQPKAALETIT